MMIQVPSHDGKKTKANLSKYPLSRQFFPRCNTIDTTKTPIFSLFLSVCPKNAVCHRLTYAYSTRHGKNSRKLLFLRPVKICLAFDTEAGCIRSTSALFIALLPFRFPAVSHPRFPDLPDGSIPARTLQLAAMPRLTPLDELPSRRFCALKFSFLFRF